MRATRALRVACLGVLLAWAWPGAARAGEAGPAGAAETGQQGLWRAWTAVPGPPGSLVVGANLDFFSMPDWLADGSSSLGLGGRLSLSGVPVEGLELTFGLTGSIFHDGGFSPAEVQVLGDPYLGVRYGYEIASVFSIGAGVQASFPTEEEFFQFSPDGISTRVLLLMGYRPLPALLALVNVGYLFDNSSRIFDRPLNEAQRYGLGINPHDQLLIRAGVAYRIGPAAAFLEYAADLAVGGGPGFAGDPSRLTVGARFWPVERHPFQLLVAADVGLTATGDVPAGAARTPPYKIVLGLAYDLGSMPERVSEPQTREVVREVVREVQVQPARIAGTVIDADTHQPIGEARVVVGGEEPATLLTDRESGRFTCRLGAAGPVELTASRVGYSSASQTVTVTPGKDSSVSFELKLEKSTGVIRGTVKSVSGKPLRARLAIPTRRYSTVIKSRKGAFSLKMRAGVIDIVISMKGYRTQRKKVELGAGETVILHVELYPKK